MSVVITNVSDHDDMAGLNQYVVRINNQPVIARFDHVRSDGLAVCLEKAAKAVREAEDRAIRDFVAACTTQKDRAND